MRLDFDPSSLRNISDRTRHTLVCDLEETKCDLLGCVLGLLTCSALFINLTGELVEEFCRQRLIQRLVFIGTEYMRKILRKEKTKEKVRVRNGKRPAFAVTRRTWFGKDSELANCRQTFASELLLTWMCTGALRSDIE